MSTQQVFRTALTEVTTDRRDRLGAIRWMTDPTTGQDRAYKYVKVLNVTATVAGVAGDPVAYRAAGAGVTNNHVVLDVTDADAQPLCAGFLMGTVAGVHSPATSYYCWIQLTGDVTVPTAVTSGVIGSGVMLGGDKTLVVNTGVIMSCGTEITATAANNRILAACQF